MKEEKKTLILEAARRLFEQYGQHKITLDDIASACSINVTSLYYYFPSKNDLLREVVRAEHNALLSELRARVESCADPEGKCLALARFIFEQLRRVSQLPGMNRSERKLVESEIEKEGRKLKDAIFQLIEEILIEGKRAGVFDLPDPHLAARMFTVGLRGLFESVLDGDLPAEELDRLEDICALMLRALKKSHS